MSPPLEDVVAEWLERVAGGEAVDPARFAAEHGLSVAELAPLLDNARWLVGRHRDQGDDHAPRLPAPPFDLDDVRVLEEAGRGGMGVVFRGVQRSLDRVVAVKVLDAARWANNAQPRARFLREARAAARLSHANVVRVLMVGESRGMAWFAMEWIEGESLAQILARRRRPADAGGEAPARRSGDARQTARLIAKVARAIQHAHEHQILHRDVKPGNILVDTDGEPHLADFGLARDFVDSELTATGDVLGSPPYMSPEQVRGERDLSPQTDVYSLGVTLYECLTLRRPFAAEATTALRQQILRATVVPPRAWDPGVPEDLQWVCLEAMTRERELRYRSAAAFAADLEAFLRGEPVHAGPPGIVVRGRRLLRRHSRLLTSVAVSAVAATVVVWAWRTRADLTTAELLATTHRVALARVTEDRGCLLTVLEEAIDRHPHEPLFLLQRAIVLLADQRAQDARVDLDHARMLRPNDAEVGAAVRAMQAANTVLAGGEPTADDQACLQSIADADSGRPEMLHLRGVLLGQLGRWDAASVLLLRARALDRSVGVEGDLSIANLRLGRPHEALVELERFTASRLTPPTSFVRCRLLAITGDLSAADAALDGMTREFPTSAYTLAARILVAGSRGDANVDLEAWLESAGHAADWREAKRTVTRALADVYHLRNEPKKAVPLFDMLLEQQPDDVNLRSVLGICCFQLAAQQEQESEASQRSRQRGRDELAKAAELSRHLPFERDYHCGMLAFFTGRIAEAVTHFEAAVTKTPGDPKRRRPLAIALASLAAATRDPALRLDSLEKCVAAHRAEVELNPIDGRASTLLDDALTRLLAALAVVGDTRADDVRQEQRARRTASGR